MEYPVSPLEKLERLEQLRLIEAGHSIATFEVEGTSLSVDTAEQLEEVKDGHFSLILSVVTIQPAVPAQ